MEERRKRAGRLITGVVLLLFVCVGRGPTVDAASVMTNLNRTTGELTITGSGELSPIANISATEKGQVIKRIVVKGNFTKIKEKTFDGYQAVRSIVLPDSIAEIGESAFRSCYDLEEMNLPKSLTTLKMFSFAYCQHLEKLTFPKGLKTVEPNAFQYSGLQEAVFEEGMTELPEDMFYYTFTLLKKVTLPSTLKRIGNNAFRFCAELSEVNLPSGLESMGSYCFSECTSLERITIPKTLTNVGENCFYDSGVQELYFEEGTKTVLDKLMYGNRALKKVRFPDSVTAIGNQAFYNCNRLSDVVLPKYLTAVGSKAFYGCYSLSRLTIPKTITFEGAICSGTGVCEVIFENGTKQIKETCLGAKNLTKVTIPSTVEGIADYAFSGCSALESITLPKGLKTIGAYAFKNCYGLKAADVPSQKATVGKDAFSTGSDLVIYGVYGSPVEKAFLAAGYRYQCKYKEMKYLTISVPSIVLRSGKNTKAKVVVKDKNKVLTENRDYTLTYKNASKVGKATVVITGKNGLYYGTVSRTFTIIPAKNEVYQSGNIKYKITNTDIHGKGTVSVKGLVKSKKSVTIPKQVKLAGYTYKVTGIESKAFYKQSKLKNITIQSTAIASFGKKAFSGIHKDAVIRTPKSCYSSYSKKIKKSQIAKTVKIKK